MCNVDVQCLKTMLKICINAFANPNHSAVLPQVPLQAKNLIGNPPSFLNIRHPGWRLVFPFLVADTQLYKRLCPFVRLSVRWSVVIELKSGKMSVSSTFLWIGDWGKDAGWTPLPIRPQRYCDTASLVSFLSFSTSTHILHSLSICFYYVALSISVIICVFPSVGNFFSLFLCMTWFCLLELSVHLCF